jgi:large subunit ribosomal protein L21
MGNFMVYAVIVSGGKQYRVAPGQTIKLETLDKEPGKTFDFEKVLLVANGESIQIGSPYLKGVKVSAEVLGEGRADKVHIIKFRRRKHHMKRAGHRQNYTEVKILAVDGVEAEVRVARAATAEPKTKTVKTAKSVKSTVAKKKAATAKAKGA